MKKKDFNFKGLKMILQSSQEDLMIYISDLFMNIYPRENCKVTENYIFGKGNKSILLVAHLDTVHKELPKLILFDSEQGIIWSPQGIGGDDRGGVYSILYILNECIKNKKELPCVLFTTNEEIGCKGAKVAAKEIQNDIRKLNFAIELDRKGKNDMVFYDCANKEFKEYIKSFGFEIACGSCSDISEICPATGICGVNLSHGVYNCHSDKELIYIDEMFETINKVIKILDDKNSKRFAYQKQRNLYSEKCLKNKYSFFEETDSEYKDFIDLYGKKIAHIYNENTEFLKKY